jgi:hypothetical protein
MAILHSKLVYKKTLGVKILKYGLIIADSSERFNLGDDIWAYATMKLLPRVDYIIDRTQLNSFRSKNNEKVAAIVGNFLFPLHNEHRFFPPKCIVPLLTSFHARITSGSWLSNQPIIDYLKVNGPVGARDSYTQNKMAELGIESYFSGCVTLTLQRADLDSNTDIAQKDYICLVDLDKQIEEKIKSQILESGMDVDIKTMSHVYDNTNLSWDERVKKVEEYLNIYSNAKFVITSRLHVALPCLAYDVPVFVMVRRFTDTDALGSRIIPYTNSMLNWCYNDDFLNNQIGIDLIISLTNKSDYLEKRNELIEKVSGFITQCESDNPPKNKYPLSQRKIDEFLIKKYGDVVYGFLKHLDNAKKQIGN